MEWVEEVGLRGLQSVMRAAVADILVSIGCSLGTSCWQVLSGLQCPFSGLCIPVSGCQNAVHLTLIDGRLLGLPLGCRSSLLLVVTGPFSVV